MRVILGGIATVVHAVGRVVQPGVETIVGDGTVCRRVRPVKHRSNVVFLQLRDGAVRAKRTRIREGSVTRETKEYALRCDGDPVRLDLTVYKVDKVLLRDAVRAIVRTRGGDGFEDGLAECG